MAESQSQLKQISIISATAAPALNQRAFVSQSPVSQLPAVTTENTCSCRSHDCNKTDVPFAVTIKQRTHVPTAEKENGEAVLCGLWRSRRRKWRWEKRMRNCGGKIVRNQVRYCLPLQRMLQRAETECSKGGNNIIAPAVFLQSCSPWDRRVQLNKSGLYIPWKKTNRQWS